MLPPVHVHFCGGEFGWVMNQTKETIVKKNNESEVCQIFSFFFLILLDQLVNEFEFQEMVLLDNQDFYSQ